MNYLILVIDELATLMMGGFEKWSISCAPGPARARRGIHMVVARSVHRGRHYRPYQGQLPHPHQLCRYLAGGLADHPRHVWTRNCWGAAICFKLHETQAQALAGLLVSDNGGGALGIFLNSQKREKVQPSLFREIATAPAFVRRKQRGSPDDSVRQCNAHDRCRLLHATQAGHRLSACSEPLRSLGKR